jgi:hypothetical protein
MAPVIQHADIPEYTGTRLPSTCTRNAARCTFTVRASPGTDSRNEELGDALLTRPYEGYDLPPGPFWTKTLTDAMGRRSEQRENSEKGEGTRRDRGVQKGGEYRGLGRDRCERERRRDKKRAQSN